MGVLAQQAGTDGMEGAGPAEARWRARRAHGGGDDALGAALHLGGGPAREGQQQDAAGIGAVDDQVGDPVRQGAGLAGAGAGNHQQRPGDVGTVRSDAVLDGTALLGIEGLKIGHEVGPTRLEWAKAEHDSVPRRYGPPESRRLRHAAHLLRCTSAIRLRPSGVLGPDDRPP